VGLDHRRVPAALIALALFAERWGIGDDFEREAAVNGPRSMSSKLLFTASTTSPTNTSMAGSGDVPRRNRIPLASTWL